MHRILWALMFLALSGLSVTARAEESPAAAAAAVAADDPHARLVDAIFAGADFDLLREQMLRQMREHIAADPEMKEMEREYPGILSQLVAALRPVIKRNNERTEVEYRSQVRDLLATRLNAREAGEATAFFSSPAGMRMMAAAYGNMTLTNSVKEIVRGDGTVSAAAVEADRKASGQRALGALSDDDEREIKRMTTGQIWFLQFRSLMPKIQELNLSTMNAEPTPEEQAEIEAVTTALIGKRMAGDKKPSSKQ